jgi:hypothetical protein
LEPAELTPPVALQAGRRLRFRGLGARPSAGTAAPRCRPAGTRRSARTAQ